MKGVFPGIREPVSLQVAWQWRADDATDPLVWVSDDNPAPRAIALFNLSTLSTACG